MGSKEPDHSLGIAPGLTETGSTNYPSQKFSTSLSIREIKIKMTLRFHLTLVKMAKMKHTHVTAHARENVEKGLTPPLLLECQVVQLL